MCASATEGGGESGTVGVCLQWEETVGVLLIGELGPMPPGAAGSVPFGELPKGGFVPWG